MSFCKIVAIIIAIQFVIVRNSDAHSPIKTEVNKFAEWKHSGSFYILTTSDGVKLPESIILENCPVLVRLYRDYFDFNQAKSNGEDVRFTGPSGLPMPYQIDEWDPVNGIAAIWVKVPVINGEKLSEIKMHWGMSGAISESNGNAVFNDSNDTLSVWHMGNQVQDACGRLTTIDTGTNPITGMIGTGRHFPGLKGLFCGEKIVDLPSESSAHSTEAWFRPERSNSTIVGWGNEGGGRGSKVRMQLRSPPHVHVDSDFSDVFGKSKIPLDEWTHVAHTYDGKIRRIYINGMLDGESSSGMMIRRPARMWIGGWYNNYDFIGDMDEVRISNKARLPEWIKFQYENQKLAQSAVGLMVQAGTDFGVSQQKISIDEGQSVMVSAKAGGAYKTIWILKKDGQEKVVATNRLNYMVQAGRVSGNKSMSLHFKAISKMGVQTSDIEINVNERLPEPVASFTCPDKWNGRTPIEIAPVIENMNEIQQKSVGKVEFNWNVSGIAVVKEVRHGKLLLKRSQNSGDLTVSVEIGNGGQRTIYKKVIHVEEPAADPWLSRIPDSDEMPEDNQFVARDFKNEGTIYCNGKLQQEADSVFARLFANDVLMKTVTKKVALGQSYSLSLKLNAGLVKYRVDFGIINGMNEKVIHSANNIVCGDAFLINGQSNADATDIGSMDPPPGNDWIRSYGSMAGDPKQARLKLWGNAVVRDRNGGRLQIGAWGMELARQIVAKHKIPICLINGAVGGSRIDQHQATDTDLGNSSTIFGRLYWRVQQARLTHGIRGVLWHQGENDQGADGPSGNFGWETYQQHFLDLAGSWKDAFPNIQNYYIFQIWPKACSMGINGSDNKLREVQRTLPNQFSRMRIMSTLGINPPGGCHFPWKGYAEMARLMTPLVERDHYHESNEKPISAPNLLFACYSNGNKDSLVLMFDQKMVWDDRLVSQFYLDGKPNLVKSGKIEGNSIILRVGGDAIHGRITYLDSAKWSQESILWGSNGVAALTFCDVPIRLNK